ncbi:UNVERIFIED_CONTAM: hypothetical protein FKN15_069592 [Acipenser sinensis]
MHHPSTFTGGRTVVGSDQPVIAYPGDDVILPCHISPSISAVDMEVRWFRERFDKPVHLYLNQNDRLSRQDSDYQDRTALSPSALQTGDISLHLRNLRYSDRGVYTCSADDGRWAEDGQTELIVEVGWRVVGSDQPVIADPGDNVILPCHISPRVSAVDMEVRWFREIFDRPVHLYLNQRDRLSRQDGAYWHRTALSPSALQTGDISLHLRNLQPSDRGVYTCLADDGRRNEEGQAEVIVAALGTQPSISVDSAQGEQTRLVCRSEGWSPEPEVIWRDRDGNDVTSLSSTTLLRDSQGLLSVSSYIKIKQQSNMFSCLVRSKIPKPDWESKLHISSDFFPGVSGWMVAFFLTLALSIGAIPLLVIQWRRLDGMNFIIICDEIRERHLTIATTDSFGAETFANTIVTEIMEAGLCPSKTLSQCYNGANVMSGCHRGVQKILQDKLGKEVPYIYCFNHQLHLVIVHAMSSEEKVEEFFTVCSSLYKFVRKPAIAVLCKGEKLKRFLEQRWTGHYCTAGLVVKSFNSIVELLSETQSTQGHGTEVKIAAVGSLKPVSAVDFRFIAHMVQNILSILDREKKALFFLL